MSRVTDMAAGAAIERKIEKEKNKLKKKARKKARRLFHGILRTGFVFCAGVCIGMHWEVIRDRIKDQDLQEKLTGCMMPRNRNSKEVCRL